MKLFRNETFSTRLFRIEKQNLSPWHNRQENRRLWVPERSLWNGPSRRRRLSMQTFGRSGEMADATDSKSVVRKDVWVQVPPPVFV
jgi:hypothetical protein